MIKIALKHYIYEACLDVMFDNITYNFRTFDTNVKLVAGRKYKAIMTSVSGGDNTTHEIIDGFVEVVDEKTFVIRFFKLKINGGPAQTQRDGTSMHWRIELSRVKGVLE